MIRLLKKKFILINMSLVLVVLLAVFTTLCVTTANTQRLNAERGLSTLLQPHEGDLPKLEVGKSDDQKSTLPQRNSDLFAGFVVSIDESGNTTIESAHAITVSDETAATLAQLVQDSGTSSGFLRAYSLRYSVAEADGVTRIAFLDTSSDLASMAELIISSLLIGGLALLAFFFVSLFLANLALKPVETAWNRQKQFVADASHELKTPLTVILANQKILLSHPEKSIGDERQWIENTQSEGNRMKSLIEDLLFLAKNDAGKNNELSGEVNFSDVAQGVLLSFASLAFEAGITLEDDIQPDIRLAGNEQQLRRLCAILLDNAVKYAETKGTVHISLHLDGSAARLCVQNSGAPIPPSELQHLFERFYRADRARSAGGYGLGLSIADSIVRAHGGRITVASTAATGTIFTVVLPLRVTDRRRGGKDFA